MNICQNKQKADSFVRLLKSISFIDRDGFHLFVVRGQNKRGKEFERTAVVSPKVPDEEVKKFLFDVGQAYLCQTNTISGK